jgi:integrase
VRRTINRLAAARVTTVRTPGMYPDGGGLYLQVTSPTAKSWVYRYRADSGHERYMGLGPTITISLQEARDAALQCRKLRYAGIDPIEHRKAERRTRRLTAVKTVTFDECAQLYRAAHEPSWRSANHRHQWQTTVANYASPVFGWLPVQAVDTSLIMKVVEPLWRRAPETASRLRGRIEAVLDWATVRGYRSGDNPARWRGHLDHLLPARSKVRAVKHHAALPYAEINALVTLLRSQEGIAARALEFVILTAARTGEVLDARGAEIDMRAGVWTIPGERMKSGREHRVPLSPQALAILTEVRELSVDGYVFSRPIRGGPLPQIALREVLRRVDRGDITVHGFRSTFTDWASEQTSFPQVVIDAALAHVVSNKVEAAYRRGDLFEKRRHLMTAWGKYCTPKLGPSVTSIGARKRGQS